MYIFIFLHIYMYTHAYEPKLWPDFLQMAARKAEDVTLTLALRAGYTCIDDDSGGLLAVWPALRMQGGHVN